MSKVAIVKCNDYSQEKVDSAVKKTVDYLGGISKFVKKGQKVLIKPNLLGGFAVEKTVTTNPAVLKSVINLVKSAGGIVYVGDSPAFGNPTAAMKKAGLYDICQETHAKIVEFKAEKFNNPDGRVAKSFLLHEKLFEYDVIIDLPKLKTHSFTDYTGAVKNLFGLVVGAEKGKYHLKIQDKVLFYEMLIDLCLFVKPKLVVMDAVIGMEGNGPAGGEARQIGLILSSADAISLDYAACKIINMESTAFHHVCEKRNIVPQVEVVGENIEKLIIKDYKRPAGYTPDTAAKRRLPKFVGEFIESSLKKVFVLDPVVNKADCTGCKTCHIVCPSEPKTITMQKGRHESKKKNPKDIYPSFNYEHCIRCYCCQESCPEKAIVLKRRFI